ncbi:uncharacterized protein LOC143223971 [Tachypleus tridentatus]|uniref:uncharacterized protein LOC143223971 n=1 Tax=Tachypleus tridentatus TaxID=6853 RepID=UPI003FD20730
MIPRKSLPVRSSSAQPRLPDIEPEKKKNISETKYKGDYEFLIHVDSPPPVQQEAWPSPLNLPPLDSEKLSPVSSGKSSRRNWAPQIEDEDVYQRLNYMEHLVETRTQELNRLRKEIDNIKMSTHRRQMVMRYPEEKTPHKDGETYVKHGLDLERLKKDKKVLSDLLKQSQRELTRKDSVVHQLNQENNRLRREAVLWETRFSDVGEKEAQINQLKEELEVVREEVACLHAEKESRMQTWQNDFENIGINSKGMSYSRGDSVENNNLKILLIDNQNFEKCFSYLLSKLSPDHEYFMRWNSVSNFNVLGQTSLEKLFEGHLEVDLDELTRQFEEFWNEQELLKKDLKQANAKIESQESTVEMLTQENEGMRQNLVTMEAKDSFINELTVMNEKLKKELEDTERKFEILSKAKENLEEDVNNTQDHIQTLQKELSVLKAEKKNSIEEAKVDVEKVEDRSSKNYKQYEANTSEDMSPRHQACPDFILYQYSNKKQ